MQHRPPDRTHLTIASFIILKIICEENIISVLLQFLPVESAVLDICVDVLIIQIFIVFFTSITCVGYEITGKFPKLLFHLDSQLPDISFYGLVSDKGVLVSICFYLCTVKEATFQTGISFFN